MKLLLAWILLVSTLHAQSLPTTRRTETARFSGLVSGRITVKGTGSPIERAVIELSLIQSAPASRPVGTDYSGREGAYAARIWVDRPHLVKVSTFGFVSQERRVEGPSAGVDFELVCTSATERVGWLHPLAAMRAVAVPR